MRPESIIKELRQTLTRSVDVHIHAEREVCTMRVTLEQLRAENASLSAALTANAEKREGDG